jgi:hypothetical protein
VYTAQLARCQTLIGAGLNLVIWTFGHPVIDWIIGALSGMWREPPIPRHAARCRVRGLQSHALIAVVFCGVLRDSGAETDRTTGDT